MVKVLGFDVGIKNLAYCIVEKVDDKFQIQSDHKQCWNIINLTEQHKLVCAGATTCTNPITQTSEIDGVKYYFCTKHKLFNKALLETKPLNFPECEDGVKCSHAASCKTKSKFMWGGSPVCSKHKEMIERNETKARSLTKYKTFVKDFTIHDLKLSLLTKLDTYKDLFLKVDVVCIENQPTFKNPTMKAISDVLYTWFMIRGLVEKEQTGSTISKITFFAPSSKLKIEGKTEDINEQIEEAAKSGSKYKKTKELGITNCLEFIKWNQEYVDHLNSFKKKDDLCDAYLHGVHYIQKNLEPAKPKVKKEKVESNSESVVQEDPKPKTKSTKSTLEIDIGVKRKPKSTKKTKKVTTNEV
jgi:hypothetical protein